MLEIKNQNRTVIDGEQTVDCLTRMIAGLDAAIAQAVENPLLFPDSTLLQSVQSQCASLALVEADNQASGIPSGLGRNSTLDAQLEALVWEVRARAGRLQRLMDSALQFYSTCFSPYQADVMNHGSPSDRGYSAVVYSDRNGFDGMSAEWCSGSPHLRIDC